MKRPVKQKYGGQSPWVPRLAGKLALVGLILALMLAGVGLTGLLVWKQMGQWSFFQLTAIGIDGCARTTKKEILGLSGVDVHSNLLALSAGKIRARVESHDWVESALVRRDWPNRLQIVVRERRPVALLSLPGGLHYLDRQGVPFALAQPPEDLDFPVITGLSALPGEQGWQGEQRLGLSRSLNLIRLAGRGGVILPAQGISEINLGGDGKMTLFLVSRPFPIHLGDGREIGRDYNRLVQVLSRLYRERIFVETAAIHMDYQPNQVLVVRAGG
ncbi:cell division protein FtsQ/DivIB [Desulfurivibrio sp. D14AmB]|uniref:cell division protein FtsQ/DivIB n=1 Tax=Desulfurivibrio sp. D14AmB TaxID=3374370 RepID=UPI00376F41A6